jgi:hypothetical protein
MMQMPGMLLFLFIPGDDGLPVARLAAAIGVQVMLWYFVIAWWLRRRAARRATRVSSPR